MPSSHSIYSNQILFSSLILTAEGSSKSFLDPQLLCFGTSLMAQGVKNLPQTQKTQETRVWSLGWCDPLEKEMQPTSVFLPEKLHGHGAWQATVQCVAKKRVYYAHKHSRAPVFLQLHNLFLLLPGLYFPSFYTVILYRDSNCYIITSVFEGREPVLLYKLQCNRPFILWTNKWTQQVTNKWTPMDLGNAQLPGLSVSSYGLTQGDCIDWG